MIEKTELTDVSNEEISIESIAAYSDAVWEMIMGNMPPEVISNNYKQYAQCLKETILSISFASKETHYLLPIGLLIVGFTTYFDKTWKKIILLHKGR